MLLRREQQSLAVVRPDEVSNQLPARRQRFRFFRLQIVGFEMRAQSLRIFLDQRLEGDVLAVRRPGRRVVWRFPSRKLGVAAAIGVDLAKAGFVAATGHVKKRNFRTVGRKRESRGEPVRNLARSSAQYGNHEKFLVSLLVRRKFLKVDEIAIGRKERRG